MAESVGKKVQKYAVWGIIALTGVGLLGFGTGSFGGGGQTIGRVGEKRISAQTYFAALQNDLRAFAQQTGQNLSFPDAQALGLPQQTLSRLVTQRALDNEAGELGISVGDAQVRDQILRGGSFAGLDGQFDRALYADALRRNGMTEGSFETQIREDLSRQFLQVAVVGGIQAPSVFTDTLVSYAGERRSITWTLLTEDDMAADLPEPSEADLRAEYEANPEDYTTPEAKEITYAILTPDMILDSVEVDEEALRDLYEQREDIYNQLERRLVERLVFGSQEQAEAAAARIEAGGTFEEEAEARGLEIADLDLGDVLPIDLGPAAEGVFAAQTLSVVGPLPSSLGPALFRVNGVLAGRNVSFEQARDELQDELALDRAARVISGQFDFLENELAGGAILEDLAATSDMELGLLSWFEGMDEGPAAYAAFQDAARAVAEGDFPEITVLEDGGVFALRLEGTTPPRLQDFDEVAEDVRVAWETQATTDALSERATELTIALADGESPDALGIEVSTEEVTRGLFLPGAPEGFLEEVFSMGVGNIRAVPGDGYVALARLDAVNPPDMADPDMARVFQAITSQISQSYAQDLYSTYAQGILDQTSVNLDQGQINGIHAQIQ